MVLSILPTGLHVNLIHEAARHTVSFADAEIVNQPGGGAGRKSRKRRLASVILEGDAFIRVRDKGGSN